MFNSKYKWLWFAAAIALSFGTPAAMLLKQVRILELGAPVKFRTRPVDPYDPFRGRYVQLAFEQGSVALEDPGRKARRGDRVYVTIATDSAGYARLESASAQRPAEGLYLATEVRYAPEPGHVWVKLPFDRYYMNEDAAPEAERLYREAHEGWLEEAGDQRAFEDGNFVVARILDGAGALESLHIDRQPIEIWLRRASEAAAPR